MDNVLRELNLLDDEDNQPIEPREPAVFEVESIETTLDDHDIKSDLKEDYKKARNLNYALLDVTVSAVASAKRLADESEHPRNFEILNQLIKTSRELNSDLINLHKTFKDVSRGTPLEQKPKQEEQGKSGDLRTLTTEEIIRAAQNE